MKKVCLFLVAVFAVLSLNLSVSAASWLDKINKLPGDSLLGSRQQHDMLAPVFSAAALVDRRCKTFSIYDTVVTKPKENNSWDELWIINACSWQVEVPITFISNGQDARPAYIIQTKKIKKIQ